MYKVSFLLETITPLFMSGADGKTLELRPSAFKGMMRFWWRAVRAESNIENLWKEEAKIFGAADEKFGRNKVKVVLKWDREEFESKKQKNSKNWLRNLNYSGVRYLLYSVGLQKREFLEPEFEFEITLSSWDTEALKQAVTSLWCLVFLGGIGTRATRGGGNLKVKQVKEGKEFLSESEIEFNITGEIEEWFRKNWEKIKQIIGSQNKKTNYTSLPKGEIFIFDPFNSWEKALNQIGENFRNFRNRKEPDYSYIRKYLISGIVPNYIEKIEFGLPLSYRFRSLNNKSAIIEGANKERQRSASSLIFKVIEQGQRFYPLIIVLNKPYLLAEKDRLKIRDTSKVRRQKAKILSYMATGIINNFLSVLPKCRRIPL